MASLLVHSTCLILWTLVVVTSLVNSHIYNGPELPEYFAEKKFLDLSEECRNDVLTAEEGSIQYKISEPLLQNERCNWVIRVVNATGYNVQISHLGFPEANSDHLLTMFRFVAIHHTLDPETYVADHVGNYDLNWTSVVLVTFHTGNKSDILDLTGFQLDYVATFADNPNEGLQGVVHENSTDHFINASEDSIRTIAIGPSPYPNWLEYGFFIDIILFHWGDYVLNPSGQFKVAFIENEFPLPTGGPPLTIYEYNPESNWQLRERIGYGNRTAMIESKDMLLITYTAWTSYNISFDLANFVCPGVE